MRAMEVESWCTWGQGAWLLFYKKACVPCMHIRVCWRLRYVSYMRLNRTFLGPGCASPLALRNKPAVLLAFVQLCGDH